MDSLPKFCVISNSFFPQKVTYPLPLKNTAPLFPFPGSSPLFYLPLSQIPLTPPLSNIPCSTSLLLYTLTPCLLHPIPSLDSLLITCLNSILFPPFPHTKNVVSFLSWSLHQVVSSSPSHFLISFMLFLAPISFSSMALICSSTKIPLTWPSGVLERERWAGLFAWSEQ